MNHSRGQNGRHSQSVKHSKGTIAIMLHIICGQGLMHSVGGSMLGLVRLPSHTYGEVGMQESFWPWKINISPPKGQSPANTMKQRLSIVNWAKNFPKGRVELGHGFPSLPWCNIVTSSGGSVCRREPLESWLCYNLWLPLATKSCSLICSLAAIIPLSLFKLFFFLIKCMYII